MEGKSGKPEKWVKVCGKEDTALQHIIESSAQARMKDKGYTQEDVEYIRKYKEQLISGNLEVDQDDLEKLRALCKLWDVELKCTEIKSHRPVIGHFIVAVKKMFFPIIKAMLKDTFKQQRNFNAQAVSLLADIINKKAAAADDNQTRQKAEIK